MKKGINLFLIMTILFCFFAPAFPVKADTTFDVYLEDSAGSNLLSSFGTYQEAYNFAATKESENQDHNLIIYKDGKIRYVTYGLVNFRTKSLSSLNTTYTIEFNNREGYTNGYYGADAAFLGTNEDGTKIRFKQAGVIGWVDYSEIELINMNAATYNSIYTSSYIAGKLVDFSTDEFMHNIATNIHSSSMSTVVLGQEIPEGMALSTKTNKTYYLSYDGHYFYPESLEGYRTMIRDYKSGVYTNAVNADKPYYNYYQFLSHRTISNYTSAQLRQDFSDYTSKATTYPVLAGQSQLYGEETSFIQYQNELGVNAILMLGVAKNESANGTSSFAVNYNNLFGHGAYDIAPGVNANRYVSVAQGIYAHARVFISEGYADPCDGYNVNGDGTSSSCHKGRYYGAYVGDKSSGINVKYASDPYWGEKAARNYYYFDKQYGLQDYGKYGIGVKTSSENYPIQSNPTSNSTILYTTGPSTSYAVTILAAVTGESINGNDVWYKIQTDPTLNSTRTGILQDQGMYDYDHNVGYIHSSYLNYVRLGKNEKNRYVIKFNPNGGTFSDNFTTTKSLTIEEYVIPDINPPTKEGYRFVGWDKQVVAATEDTTYTAVYEPLNITYTITFQAGEGKFTDGSNIREVSTKAGEIPTVETPNREGYVFVGWSPTLESATKNTSYVAQYKKESDIEWKETDGEFYFHELTSDKEGLHITGYSTINGISINESTLMSFEIQFENMDTGEITTIPCNQITNKNEMPFEIGSINGYIATYSWFQGTIPLDSLKEGNYRAYIVTRSGTFYTKKLVRNLLGKTMVGSYEANGRQMWIRNNYYLKTVPMEFFVRDKEIGLKNNNPIDNMITGYSSISFEGTELKIRGFAHNVGGNYGLAAPVSRSIILENTSTFQTLKQPITTITNGDYIISLRVPDGYDKTKAWFEGSIDIRNLEKGIYVIYICNEANINDFAELNDIFGKAINAKTTVDGKQYSLRINADLRYRIELVVE